MKRIIFILTLPVLLFVLASLSNGISQTPKYNYSAKANQASCNGAMSKASGSCEGCHPSNSNGSGPIIIVRYKGMESSDVLNINSGSNIVYIYYEDEQNSMATPGSNDIQVAKSLKNDYQLDVKEKDVQINTTSFAAVHGEASENILNHLQKLEVYSAENRTITLSNNITKLDYSLSYTSQQLQFQFETKKEQSVHIALYDLQGNLFINPHKQLLPQGVSATTISTERPLRKGIYIMQLIKADGDKIIEKIYID